MVSLEKRLKGRLLASYKFMISQIEANALIEYVNLRLPYFTDHGKGHINRIIQFLETIITQKHILSPLEIYLLLCSCWLHDFGMMLGERKGHGLTEEETRQFHSELSKDLILSCYKDFGILDNNIAELIGDICLSHPRKYKIDSWLKPRLTVLGETIRPQLIASLLRLSDAFDIDSRRASGLKSNYVIKLPESSKKHWEVCKHIYGVRPESSKMLFVIDAHYNNKKGLILLKWKIRDITDDLLTVKDILIANNFVYNNTLLDIFDTRKRNHETYLGTDLIKEEMSLKKNFESRKENFFDGLSKIWKDTKLDKLQKIKKSRNLYKKNFFEYSYIYSIDKEKQRDIKIVYLSKYYTIQYKENGISIVFLNIEFVNISDHPVYDELMVFEAVLPVIDNKLLKFRAVNSKNNYPLNWRITQDTYKEKTFQIYFPKIKPGEIFRFGVVHEWPYPKSRSRRRWYIMTPWRFCSDLGIQIQLPLNNPPKNIEVRLTPKSSLWEEVIAKLNSKHKSNYYYFNWEKKINTIGDVHKIYFDTPY